MLPSHTQSCKCINAANGVSLRERPLGGISSCDDSSFVIKASHLKSTQENVSPCRKPTQGGVFFSVVTRANEGKRSSLLQPGSKILRKLVHNSEKVAWLQQAGPFSSFSFLTTEKNDPPCVGLSSPRDTERQIFSPGVDASKGGGKKCDELRAARRIFYLLP